MLFRIDRVSGIIFFFFVGGGEEGKNPFLIKLYRQYLKYNELT